jgi:hypothetical protein
LPPQKKTLQQVTRSEVPRGDRPAVVAEYVARTALAHIAGSNVILHHFANAATLAEFWKLDADKRRVIWGPPGSIDDTLNGYDPRYISDGELGKP